MAAHKIIGVSLAAALLTASQLVSASADAADGSSILVRLRGIGVIPDEDSSVSVIGGSVDAENVAVPELDISYFFTPNIALELILAVSPHDMQVEGSALGTVDLGEVTLLPPTLTLQYHFLPDSQFRPYVGVGINYTFFLDESAPRGVVQSIDYENGFGYAFQAGMDYALTETIVLNLDLKKVFLNTDVAINGGAINADVDLDPWIVGAGVGYRFNL